MQEIKLFFIALSVFFLIDMLWLGLVANNFYKQHIGFLMKSDVNWIAAILFYLIFIVALVVFVIAPAYAQGNVWNSILLGAFFGLATYSTYDLTNLATIKDWPIIVTVVDLVWGMVLSASVSAVTVLIATAVKL